MRSSGYVGDSALKPNRNCRVARIASLQPRKPVRRVRPCASGRHFWRRFKRTGVRFVADAGCGRKRRILDFATGNEKETSWRKACWALMGARALSGRTDLHPFLTGCQNRLDVRPASKNFVRDLFHAKPRDRGIFSAALLKSIPRSKLRTSNDMQPEADKNSLQKISKNLHDDEKNWNGRFAFIHFGDIKQNSAGFFCLRCRCWCERFCALMLKRRI